LHSNHYIILPGNMNDVKIRLTCLMLVYWPIGSLCVICVKHPSAASMEAHEYLLCQGGTAYEIMASGVQTILKRNN